MADGPVGRPLVVNVGGPRGTGYGGDRLPPPPGRCGIEFMRMVSTMLGRRVGAGAVALALVAMIGLSGCKQDNTPKAYNTLTEQNFVELCTNHLYESTGDLTDSTSGNAAPSLDPALKSTGTTIKSGIDALSQDQCLCQYQVFVNQIPVNKSAAQAGYSGPNFTDLNSKLKTDPETAWATLPDSVTTALKTCVSTNGQASPSTDSTTTTSAAPTTTVAG